MRAIVKNLKSNLITTYESSKDMYRDLMDRDLSIIGDKDLWEVWFDKCFVKECSEHRNRNFVVLDETSGGADKGGEYRPCLLDNFWTDFCGTVRIDKGNRIVEIRIKGVKDLGEGVDRKGVE